MFYTVTSHPQIQVGIFLGVSDYSGDLLDKTYYFSHPALGLTGGYQISDHFTLRVAATTGKIEGSDYPSNRGFSKRNLSFQSAISEIAVTGEHTILNMTNRRWSPFIFAGLAMYHYNPYTLDQNNQKVYLRPLSTEGQGLTEYGNRKPYSLTQFSLPVGGGIKYDISNSFQITAQIGLRVTNNDYIDDVSKTYVDQNLLLAARGVQAVELSYRGDELPGGDQDYPKSGTLRGRSGKIIYNDFYYFSGVHLIFKSGNGDNYGYGGGRFNKKQISCPTVF